MPFSRQTRSKSTSTGGALNRPNQHLIAALRDALLVQHELVGREIEAVLDAAGGPVPSTTASMVIDLRDEVIAQPVVLPQD